MKRFNNMKIVFVGISLVLFSLSCSVISEREKVNIELVQRINSKYYSLSKTDVKKVSFRYKSSKYDGLVRQVSNSELSRLMAKIEFNLYWDGGTDVSTLTRNVPHLNNGEANQALVLILEGIRHEIKGMFLVLAPYFEDLIRYKRSIDLTETRDGENIILKLKHRISSLQEVLYFDLDYRLTKIETYNADKLTAVNNFEFELLNGKYILHRLETNLLSNNKKISNSITVSYVENKDTYFPSKIILTSDVNGQTVINNVELTLLDTSK